MSGTLRRQSHCLYSIQIYQLSVFITTVYYIYIPYVLISPIERWPIRHTLRIERPAYFEADCVLRILKIAAVGGSAYCVLRIAYWTDGCGWSCVLRIAYCVLRIEVVLDPVG